VPTLETRVLPLDGLTNTGRPWRIVRELQRRLGARAGVDGERSFRGASTRPSETFHTSVLADIAASRLLPRGADTGREWVCH